MDNLTKGRLVYNMILNWHKLASLAREISQTRTRFPNASKLTGLNVAR